MTKTRLAIIVVLVGALAGATGTWVLSHRNGSSAATADPSTIGSDVPAAVAQSRMVGELPGDRAMSVQVLLPMSSDPKTAEDFLRRSQLQVQDLPEARLINATGSVRAIEAVFAVRLDTWQNNTTHETFYANNRPATFPFPVTGVFGLDNATRLRPLSQVQRLSLFGGSGGYSAAQLRTAYNANLPNVDGGKGQRVAIQAVSNFDSRDISQFSRDNGLPDPDIGFHWLLQPGEELPQDTDSHQNKVEVEGDIEAVHAIAPYAGIDVYETDETANFLTHAALDGDHIASISYGFCQSDLRPREAQDRAQLTARVAGGPVNMSIFAGSGDKGKSCLSTNDGSYHRGVNYPASLPSVTAVGGTHLDLNQDDRLNSEQALDQPNGSISNTQASGGGPVDGDSSFPRPEWQQGLSVSGTQRMIPDVAADADASSSGLKVYFEGNWRTFGGTSLASPLWAGIAALYNQYAEQQPAPLLGLANPLLYTMDKSDRPLFDVTTTQNGGNDLAGPAGPGWDAATGLGTPNAYVLIQDGVRLSTQRRAARITYVCPEGATFPFGLCAVNGDGGGRASLVSGAAAVNGGELSPDGSELTYFVGPNADSHIWVAHADGSHPVDLGPGGDSSWSPEGGRLVYTLSARAGGVWMINADGTGGARQISAVGRSGRWSPDGQRILFVVDPGGSTPSGVYTVPQQGGASKMLVPGATDAAWSPDGTRIAFIASPPIAGTSAWVWVANADGSGARALDSPPQAVDSSPSWAPDGTSVLVERDTQQGSDHQFVAISSDGSGQQRSVLAFTPPDNGYSPRWGGGLGLARTLLVGRGLAISGAFGVPLAAVPVADFSRLNPQGQPATYSATVDWGDNSAKSAGVVQLSVGPSGAKGIVSADHTYQQMGTYTVTTTVHMSGSALSEQSFTGTGQASISWGVLRAARPFSVPAGTPVQGLLAELSYPSSLGPLPTGTLARIEWNDPGGATSVTQQLRPIDAERLGRPPGSVTTIGIYDADGHAYSEPADYTATLTLLRWGKSQLAVQLHVYVH
jgi:kumamolisin